MTVNLVRRAVRALDIATDTTGENRTDTVNRALQVYAYVAQAEMSGKAIYIEAPDGTRERLLV
jgi:hypothetical protein